jgi:23S rRNA (uracil1939-C5)-methyltransferase
MVTRGDQLELDIDSAAFEGTTVARTNGLVVFVPYGVPGDRVRATITRKRRKYVEASIDEVISASPHRIEPECLHFGICGGCTLQNVDYDHQLEIKRELVKDLLARIGGIQTPEVRPTIPSPERFHYRNKMEFSFGTSRWMTREEIASGEELQKGFALGLHIPKRFDKILDLEECHLQRSPSSEIVNRVREYVVEKGWPAYNSRSHEGYLRNLCIRMGARTDDILVNLVTASHVQERVGGFSSMLLQEFPTISTIINSINGTRSPVAVEQEIVLHGNGWIRERIQDLDFRISPTSFFQPNAYQVENLFSEILAMAEPGQDALVYDLYCGLGAISLFLARTCRSVLGVENHSESVRMAAENAERNRVENCSFVAADAVEALKPDFIKRNGQPEVLILDPPRAGLHPDVVKGLLRVKPKRIVYSSCNPATQARDLKILTEEYRVSAVQPVDMFPQTFHIESVVALELGNRPAT